MRSRNTYHLAGKISLALVLLGGVVALTLPAIRKRIWFTGKPGALLLSKEHNVVLNTPVAEEVSIVQTRCHPGI